MNSGIAYGRCEALVSLGVGKTACSCGLKWAKEYKETRENCYMVLYLLAIVT